jgi:hypothetical protein
MNISSKTKRNLTATGLKLFFISFPFVLLAGCQYDPHAHLLTTTEPRPEDIVGTYVLDRFYLPDDVLIKDRNIKVDLRSDGTFTATNIPPWELKDPDNKFFSELLSGEGKWEKDVLGRLDPGSKEIWGIYLRSNHNKFHPAQLTGEKPPYGLIFTLGDPDSGNAILLKKE